MNIKLRWIVESNVLDSFAILSFMQDEQGAEVVGSLLRDAQAGGVRLLVSVINLGEVFHRLAKSKGGPVATEFRRALSQRTFPWQAVSATDARIWAAAQSKAQCALAYADAFAVALAREAHAPVCDRRSGNSGSVTCSCSDRCHTALGCRLASRRPRTRHADARHLPPCT